MSLSLVLTNLKTHIVHAKNLWQKPKFVKKNYTSLDKTINSYKITKNATKNIENSKSQNINYYETELWIYETKAHIRVVFRVTARSNHKCTVFSGYCRRIDMTFSSFWQQSGISECREAGIKLIWSEGREHLVNIVIAFFTEVTFSSFCIWAQIFQKCLVHKLQIRESNLIFAPLLAKVLFQTKKVKVSNRNGLLSY